MTRPGGDHPTPLQGVLEVQGRFPDHATLKAAIEDLRGAGYVHADASLPADLNDPTGAGDDSSPTPQDHQQLRVLTASLSGTAGAMLAGVAVLASGAAIPLAAGAALVAGVGSGALMELIGHRVEEKQMDEYDRRGAAGTLVLAMRVSDEADAEEVSRIMRDNGAVESRSITREDETLVPRINPAAWTG